MGVRRHPRSGCERREEHSGRRTCGQPNACGAGVSLGLGRATGVEAGTHRKRGIARTGRNSRLQAGGDVKCRARCAQPAIAGLLFGFAGTTAYAIETAATPHSGSIPTSGPNTGRGMGGGPGGGAAPDGTESGTDGTTSDAAASGRVDADGSRTGDGGGPGGSTSNNTALQQLLTSTDNRWAAATVGSQSAGSLELSTGTAVMAIGGFTGGDNSPALTQFQQYVTNGEIHYFIAGGGMGGPGGGSGSASEITAWVKANFTAVTVGATTVYDLSRPLTS